MSSLARPEDGPPCIPPPDRPTYVLDLRPVLARASHQASADLARTALRDAAGAIAEAARLVDRGRRDEARCEMAEAARCVAEAKRLIG